MQMFALYFSGQRSFKAIKVTLFHLYCLRILLKIFFFFLFSQNSNQVGVARGRGGVGQSRRGLAPRQTRLSRLRVTGNSPRKHHLLWKGCGHVVAWRHSLHDARGTVSYTLWNCFFFCGCTCEYLRLLGNGKSHEFARVVAIYFFFSLSLLPSF